jgi:TrmH RNA methyltransferase
MATPRKPRPSSSPRRPLRDDRKAVARDSAPARFKRDRDDSPEDTTKPRRERKIPVGSDRLDEIKACGVNACTAIFKARPADVVRAYVTEDNIKEFADLLKFCSKNKKAYHVVRPDELNRISASTHHEGVCIIAKAAPTPSWAKLLETYKASKKATLILVLEDVGNPHNVGAIVRTAAHFGAAAILAPGLETFKPSPSLLRTAEGGYEAVSIVPTPDLKTTIEQLKSAEFKVVATDARGKVTLFDDTALSKRTAFIIGNESRGVSPIAKKLADQTLSIPGTGRVESLNVSAATASICSEYWRAFRN